MVLFILSFVAGVLTVAAPCVLPLLPVIVGGSVRKETDGTGRRRWLGPIVIAASLAFSVVVFTLLIKSTTALLGVPQLVWQIIAGGIVVLLGLSFMWPHWWEKVAAKSFVRSNALLGKAYKQQGYGGDALIGAALGPVFSSCSPTYAFIVATVLPASFAQGLLYLSAYAVGMSATLLLIAYSGQAIINKLRWLNAPSGWFKRAMGILFVIVGLAVIVGLDKKIQAYVLEKGWYDPISNLELRLRERL